MELCDDPNPDGIFQLKLKNAETAISTLTERFTGLAGDQTASVPALLTELANLTKVLVRHTTELKQDVALVRALRDEMREKEADAIEKAGELEEATSKLGTQLDSARAAQANWKRMYEDSETSKNTWEQKAKEADWRTGLSDAEREPRALGKPRRKRQRGAVPRLRRLIVPGRLWRMQLGNPRMLASSKKQRLALLLQA
jgi:chromosome segregation ATPase